MKITKNLFEKKELLGKSAIIHTRTRRRFNNYDYYTKQDTYIVDIFHTGIEYDYNKAHYPCDGRNVSIEYREDSGLNCADPWFDIIASNEFWVAESEFDNDDCWIEIMSREEVISRLNECIKKFFNAEKENENTKI